MNAPTSLNVLTHFYITSLHLVHRPGHIDLEQGGGEALLLNNFEVANTNSHSNHFATFNSGNVGRCCNLSNINLTVIQPVLTWEGGLWRRE